MGRKLSAETKAKISVGNLGRKRTDESKAKMRAAKVGRKLSEEHKAKIGASGRGRKHSEETIAKMRISMTDEHKERLRRINLSRGNWKHTEEAKAKMRGRRLSEEHLSKLRGKKRSEEIKAKMRGRIITEAHREKLRQSRLGRKTGEETIAKLKKIHNDPVFRYNNLMRILSVLEKRPELRQQAAERARKQHLKAKEKGEPWGFEIYRQNPVNEQFRARRLRAAKRQIKYDRILREVAKIDLEKLKPKKE